MSAEPGEGDVAPPQEPAQQRLVPPPRGHWGGTEGKKVMLLTNHFRIQAQFASVKQVRMLLHMRMPRVCTSSSTATLSSWENRTADSCESRANCRCSCGSECGWSVRGVPEEDTSVLLLLAGSESSIGPESRRSTQLKSIAR